MRLAVPTLLIFSNLLLVSARAAASEAASLWSPETSAVPIGQEQPSAAVRSSDFRLSKGLVDFTQIIESDDEDQAAAHELQARRELDRLEPSRSYERMLATAALARAVHLQGRFKEADGLHDDALAAAGASADPKLLSHMLFNAAESKRQLELWQNAADLSRRSLKLRLELRDAELIAASEIQLGITTMELGHFDAARTLIQSSYERRSKRLGPSAGPTMNALAWLGRLLTAEGRDSEASDIFRRVYVARRAAGDGDLLADAASDLADSLESNGQIASAEAFRREALRAAEASDEERIGWLQYALGHNLLLQSKWSEAERHLLEAKAKLERGGNSSTFDIRDVLNDVAWTYMETGRTEMALPILRAMLEAEEQRVGKDHVDVAATLSIISAALLRSPRASDALPLLSRARTIYVKHGDRIKLAGVERQLSAAHLALGRHGEASAAADRALEALSGDEYSLDYANALVMKGAIAAAEFRSRDWANYFSKALTIRKRLLGWAHPDTQAVASDLISALKNVRQFDVAADIAREWMAALANDGDDIAYISATSRFGHTLLAQERWAEAKPVLTSVVERSLGRSEMVLRIHLADAWAGLAQIELAAGQAERAAELLQRSLASWRSIVSRPEGKRNVAAVARHLGNTLMALGRAREAEPLLRESRALFKEIDGNENTNAAWATSALADAVAARGSPHEANELYKEALRQLQTGEIEAWLLEPLEGSSRLALEQLDDPLTASEQSRRAARIAVAESEQRDPSDAHARLRRQRAIFELQVRSDWRLYDPVK